MGKLSARHAAWTIALATVLAVALTARLGFWQLDRAAQKQSLLTQLETRDRLPVLSAQEALSSAQAGSETSTWRHVRLQGQWQPQATVYLDNRQMDGRVGFYVVTPLRLQGRDDAVMVQRGWTPRNMADRTAVQPVPTSAGDVVVEGRIAPSPSRLYEFADAASGPIRQNLDPVNFGRETGLTLLPWSVQLTSSSRADAPAAEALDDGLLRDWPRPSVDISKHHGYAFQWFALSALFAGLYVWFQLLRPRLRRVQVP